MGLRVRLVLLVCLIGSAAWARRWPPPRWPDYLREYRPVPGLLYRVSPKDGMPQVRIQAGRFLMGSTEAEVEAACRSAKQAGGGDACRDWFTNELPRRRVRLHAYWMDLHPVTNAQYARFLNDRRPTDDERPGWVLLSPEGEPDCPPPRLEWTDGEYRVVPGYEQHPVICVSWYGASAYTRWAGRRLPSEAEWERAARAGHDGSTYVWGNGPPAPDAANLADEACHRQYAVVKPCWPGYDDGYPVTSPVCAFTANPFGLFDMVGNVLNWCEDWYDPQWYARMPAVNPVNRSVPSGAPHRVLRGSDWACQLWAARIAIRSDWGPYRHYNDLGFRCAQDD